MDIDTFAANTLYNHCRSAKDFKLFQMYESLNCVDKLSESWIPLANCFTVINDWFHFTKSEHSYINSYNFIVMNDAFYQNSEGLCCPSNRLHTVAVCVEHQIGCLDVCQLCWCCAELWILSVCCWQWGLRCLPVIYTLLSNCLWRVAEGEGRCFCIS